MISETLCCLERFIFCVIFFFFQAEDGIRDYKVTGVQTCALPISKINCPQLVSVTGSRSVSGLNGNLGYSDAFITRVFTVTKSVWPLAGERTTASVPIFPEAPGLFSTTTGRPWRLASKGPMVRAIVSIPVPGVKGTINFRGTLSVLAMALATGKPNTPNPLVFKNCRLPTKFRM